MTKHSTEIKGMKMNRIRQFVLVITALTLLQGYVYAGNEDRAGEAGAPELLINPWARSVGFAGANSAIVKGIESIHTNVAGLASTKGTDLIFSNTTWLKGTGIQVNAVGLGQKVGESGVLGLSIMAMDFGDIDVTTAAQPEGGLGTFNVQYLNIGLSYAKVFSRSIYGGFTVKSISQSTANLYASSMAIDAGVKYQTGYKERIKFGISLRNVGPPITFSGDGIDVPVVIDNGTEVGLTVKQRSAKAELPSLINIGAGYDLFLSPTSKTDSSLNETLHILTLAGNFTSNSFTKDQYRLGVQYGFNPEVAKFNVRAGYIIEKDILDTELSTNAQTGFTAGLSVERKFGGSSFALDYGYQHSTVFDGYHTIGFRITL